MTWRQYVAVNLRRVEALQYSWSKVVVMDEATRSAVLPLRSHTSSEGWPVRRRYQERRDVTLSDCEGRCDVPYCKESSRSASAVYSLLDGVRTCCSVCRTAILGDRATVLKDAQGLRREVGSKKRSSSWFPSVSIENHLTDLVDMFDEQRICTECTYTKITRAPSIDIDYSFHWREKNVFTLNTKA